jgi:hypothetical protein
MSIDELINRPCTVTRHLEGDDHDAYGDEIPDDVEVATVCELQGQSGYREESEGVVSDTRWNLFLPAGTEISSGDTVTVDGCAYEVEGDPWPARNPRTHEQSHVEAVVRRTAAPADLPEGS